MNAKPQTNPENIRMGAPYDNPKFESLCRQMDIWGTAQAALCAVFWRSAGAALAVKDAEIAALTAERDALRKDALRAATVAFALTAESDRKALPEDARQLADWIEIHAFPLLDDRPDVEGLFLHIIRDAMTMEQK